MADTDKITLGHLKSAMSRAKNYTDNEIANITSISKVEPEEADLPKVFFTGDKPTTKDSVYATIEYISKTDHFKGYVDIKCQGTSSMSYPKKNYTIKMFTDSTKATKLKKDFKGWGKQNKFCLKANYIDCSHSRNVCSAKLWGQVVASRSDFDTLPEELKNSPNYGAVDGFFIKVYYNGDYEGLYTWNIPKDGWMNNMDDKLDTHCILCGEEYDSGCFRSVNAAVWSDELHDVMPANITTSFNNFQNFVINSTDDDFKANLSNYADINSLIDYYIFQYVICGLDSMGKNQLFFTYDGTKWLASSYDMDSTFGLYWDGQRFVSSEYRMQQDYESGIHTANTHNSEGNLLYVRLERLFSDEIKARYAELRANVLSYANIVNVFETFMAPVSKDLFTESNNLYSEIPSKDTNNITQIRNYTRDRLTYVDGKIAELGPSTEVACTSVSLDKTEVALGSSTTKTNLLEGITPTLRDNGFGDLDAYYLVHLEPGWYCMENINGASHLWLQIKDANDVEIINGRDKTEPIIFNISNEGDYKAGFYIGRETDTSNLRNEVQLCKWVDVEGGGVQTFTQAGVGYFDGPDNITDEGTSTTDVYSNEVTLDPSKIYMLRDAASNHKYSGTSCSNPPCLVMTNNNDAKMFSKITYAGGILLRNIKALKMSINIETFESIEAFEIVEVAVSQVTDQKLNEQLVATLTPTNTTDTLTWSVSPAGVVTVVDGLVTAVRNGNATITATCGTQSATCAVTVSGMAEKLTSILAEAWKSSAWMDGYFNDYGELIVGENALNMHHSDYIEVNGDEEIVLAVTSNITDEPYLRLSYFDVNKTFLGFDSGNGWNQAGGWNIMKKEMNLSSYSASNNIAYVVVNANTATKDYVIFKHKYLAYELVRPVTLNGTSDYIDTGVKLFDTDKSFTIYMDFVNNNGSNVPEDISLLHCMHEVLPFPGLSMTTQNILSVDYYQATTRYNTLTNLNTYGEQNKVFVTKQSGEHIIRIYVNGSVLTRELNGVQDYSAVNETTILGAYRDASGNIGRFYNGVINECKIWVDKVLTTEEMNTILNDNLLYELPQETTFNGTSDYIDTGVALCATDQNYTILMDFTPSVTQNTQSTIFHCLHETEPYHGITMQMNDTQIIMPIGNNERALGSNVGFPILPIGSTRQKFAVVRNGNIIKLLSINGKDESVYTHTNVTENLLLGAYQDADGNKGRYFTGTMHKCKVYKKALSNNDIYDFIYAGINRNIEYELQQETTFNGTSDCIDTGISLMDYDSINKDWTILLDFTLNSIPTTITSIIHCMTEITGYPGISLDIDSGQFRIVLPNENPHNLVASTTDRIQFVITKSGNTFTVYDSNMTSLARNITDSIDITTKTLILGAYQELNGTKGRFMNGTIHRFKITEGVMSNEDCLAWLGINLDNSVVAVDSTPVFRVDATCLNTEANTLTDSVAGLTATLTGTPTVSGNQIAFTASDAFSFDISSLNLVNRNRTFRIKFTPTTLDTYLRNVIQIGSSKDTNSWEHSTTSYMTSSKLNLQHGRSDTGGFSGNTVGSADPADGNNRLPVAPVTGQEYELVISENINGNVRWYVDGTLVQDGTITLFNPLYISNAEGTNRFIGSYSLIELYHGFMDSYIELNA